MQSVKKTVSCPVCQAAVSWSPAAQWRPFCSERCKLIDLGAWAANAYAVPGSSLEDPITPDARDDHV